MLKIYNTLTRTKENFTPITQDTVRMYVCGVTVYDYFHIGNARTLSVFDMVYRWLTISGFSVMYVRNITDVDDKIIQRAHKNQESIADLTTRMIDAMHQDTARLGLLAPTHEPCATAYISHMVEWIRTLISKGLAYVAQNQDVFYAVRKFPGYGKLSGKTLDHLQAGERVEIDTYKQDPLDFVLWKATKPGEPAWQAPWGMGRPGWHIECSVMSEALLGEHFDIHGGGQDLQFPHHENEIAQSEGLQEHPFVNYWMHTGFLNINNEKMSKSLGNTFITRDVLDKIRHPEILRFFLLRSHYRHPLHYSEESLQNAQEELDSFYFCLRDVPVKEVSSIDWATPYASDFKEAMDDDFNTWEAFLVLSTLRKEINKTKDPYLSGLLRALGGTLGFLQQSDYLKKESAQDNGIEALITERNQARQQKDFIKADGIRIKLESMGILLEDQAQGTVWRYK